MRGELEMQQRKKLATYKQRGQLPLTNSGISLLFVVDYSNMHQLNVLYPSQICIYVVHVCV